MHSTVRFIARAVLGLTLLLTTTSGQAQVVSTKGREFVVGFMENLSNASNDLRRLYVSADRATTVTITVPGTGFSSTINVPANGVAFQDLTPFNTFTHLGEGTQSLGIVVTATDSISLFALNYTELISDATVVLPVNNLGTDYFAMTVPGSGPTPTARRSQVMVVAVSNNTTVEITPAATTSGGRAAGAPFTVNLNRGQTFQIQSLGDLTGTRVRSLGSCAPIAVFSGNIWQQVCGQIGVFGGDGGLGPFLPFPLSGACVAGNHLVEQMLPLKTWGRTYLVVPYLRRRSDYIRIQAQEANTQVFLNGTPLGNIGPGQFIPYPNDPSGATLLNQPTLITADKPIAVAHFSQSHNMNLAGDRVGDPFFIMLSPVEQNLKNVSFSIFGPPNPANAYVNILTKTAGTAGVRLRENGLPFAGAVTFQPIAAAPQFSFARVRLTPTTSIGFASSFNLQADSGFAAQVYMFGEGVVEAYGYSVGVALENLTLRADLRVEPPYCSGLPNTFEARTTIPTDSWTWDFGDGTVRTGATLDSLQHTYVNGGTYKLKLTVTRSASCATDSVVRFIQVTGARTILTPDTTVCEGTSFRMRSTAGAASYQWTPASNLSSTTIASPQVNNLLTTTTYQLRTQVDSCVFRDTVVVTVAPRIVITSPAADTLVCQNASVTLRANQPATWTLRRAGATTVLATGTNQIVLTTPVVGTDTVFAATPFCTTSRRLIVRERARILSPLPLNQTVCTGTTLAPTSEIRTSWLLFAAPATLTPLASNTTACPPVRFDNPGSFAIISRNCSRDDTLRVTVTTLPILFTNDTTICRGVGIPLLTRPASSYVWSPATGLSSTSAPQPTASPTVTTRYFVIATIGACTYRDSVLVTVSPPLSIATPQLDTLLCVGQTATFRSNLAGTWRRRRGGTVTVLSTGVNQLIVNFPTVGTDTIEVTNIGCTVRRVVTVRGIATIIQPATSTLDGCTSRRETFRSDFPGDWFVRRGAAAPVLWASNTTTPPPIPFPTVGTDSVIVRSCNTQRGVRVVVQRAPVITPMRDTTFCIDRSVIVRSDIPALFFRLDVRGFRQIGTGPLTQIDTLTFIEGNNIIIARSGICDDTFRVVGVVQQPLILTPASNVTVCQGGQVSFTSREVGIWYRRRNGVEVELERVVNSLTVTFNTPGIDTIRIRNCASFSDRVVTVNPRPFITPDVSALTICQNGSVSFASAVPATWTVTGPAPVTISNPTASPGSLSFNTPGVYRFLTDALGCRDTLTLTVNPVPVLTVVPAQTRNVSCNGRTDGTLGLSLTGALAPYAVNWSNGATTPTITGLAAGTYTATVTDARGCVTTAPYNVTQPAPLQVTAVRNDTLRCRDILDGEISLTVTGGTPPYATDGVPGTRRTALDVGSYTLTVADANGCTTTALGTVTSPPLLTLSLSPIAQSCMEVENGSVASTVSGGVTPYTYAWDNGRTTANLGRVSAGPYSLTVTDANACTRTATTTIPRLDPPSIAGFTNPALPIFLILPQTEVQFVGTTDRGTVFAWDFGDGATSTLLSPRHTFRTEGEFTARFTVTDTAGCSNTLELGLITILEQPTLNVPNVFTPNGDGVNDRLVIEAPFTREFVVRVYDRWGRVVFSSTNPSFGWDGTLNGTPAPAGVYFYELKATFINGLGVSRTGNVTLLR